ncbi:MAG: amidoligase family protein [Rubricella sp.]
MTDTSFDPLPVPLAADGAERRVGVEIEFGGLQEGEAAAIAAGVFGGRAERVSEFAWAVKGADVGDIDVYLDTAFRERASNGLLERGLDLARVVVPVEIVLPPLHQSDLPLLDTLRRALRAAGAEGTRDGFFLGFGVHFNPEIAGEAVEDLLPTMRAFALMEDWLREQDQIDPSRRLLPFTDPWPRSFVDRIVREDPPTAAALIDLYLEETPTRNRALDMLCAFRHMDEERTMAGLPRGVSVSARPTYHYRLPDCRIDEKGWSFAYEWNRWVRVERLAATPDALDRLRSRWVEHREAILTTRFDWPGVVEEELRAHGLLEG